MSNKDKINSQDSSFNYKDIDEYSFEQHHKKIMSDSTSLISSSSEPESLTDSESGSYFRTKNRSAYVIKYVLIFRKNILMSLNSPVCFLDLNLLGLRRVTLST